MTASGRWGREAPQNSNLSRNLHHAPMAIPPSTVKLWPVMYAALSSVAMNLSQRRRKQRANTHTHTHTHTHTKSEPHAIRSDEAGKEVGKGIDQIRMLHTTPHKSNTGEMYLRKRSDKIQVYTAEAHHTIRPPSLVFTYLLLPEHAHINLRVNANRSPRFKF